MRSKYFNNLPLSCIRILDGRKRSASVEGKGHTLSGNLSVSSPLILFTFIIQQIKKKQPHKIIMYLVSCVSTTTTAQCMN